MARNLTTGLQRGLRRSIAGGLGASDLFSVASLDLRFAQQKTLDPRITFTRASSGTYVGSDGLIKTATTNLLLRSEEFDNAYWVLQSGTSVTANQAIAPNGTLTADLVQSDGNNGLFSSQVTVSGNSNNTKSVWARSVTGTATVLLKDAQATGSITTCNLTTTWQRFSLTETQNGGSCRLWIDDIPAAGIYIWGAQLEQSSTVGEYIPTTSTINSAPRFDHNPTTGESLGLLVEEQRTNLVLNSENLQVWAKGLATVTDDSIASPTGAVTADLITLSAGTGQKGVNASASTTGSVTYSVFLKAGTHSIVQLLQGGNANNYANFNIANGTVGSTGTGVTASVVAYGNGWYRCIMSHSNTVSGVYINAAATTSDGFFPSISITGNFYAWGAQLEAGSFPTSYIPTTTATVTRSADVASITGANFGVSRTNYIRNNTMVGAVAGTPGTPPTNWVTVLNGLTQTVVGAGSSNGINYIDIRFNGTTTSAGFIQIKPDGNAGAISASASQAWAMSSWMAIVGGSTANTTSQQFLLNEYSAGPTYLRTATLASNTLSGGANLTRVSGTITTGASTTIIEPLITLGHNSGAAIDITLRIGLPQLELGSTATAPIPTTNAAVTVFESSWYNQTEGTVFADYNVYAPSGSYSAAEVSDGTSSNRMILFHTAGGSARFLTFASGSAVVTTLDRTAAAASKWTGAYKAGDYGSTYNANAALTNTYNSIITGSQIRIGSSVTGSNFAGTIRRLTYWPSRLPNATLQQITR